MLFGSHRFVEREQSQTSVFENFANPVRFEPVRVWDNMTELLRDNFVVMGCIALSSKVMGMSFAWVLDVDDKECSPWLEEENENLGYIFDGLEMVIGCGTLRRAGHQLFNSPSYLQTHDYDVEFKAVQLAFFAFELCADSAHFLWCNPLIRNTLVEVVYQCLGDIDTNYGFGIGG